MPAQASNGHVAALPVPAFLAGLFKRTRNDDFAPRFRAIAMDLSSRERGAALVAHGSCLIITQATEELLRCGAQMRSHTTA